MLIFAPEKPSFCFKIARMPLPQQLLDIRDYLIANPLELSSPHQDGRINASVNEDEVLTMLRRRFNIISPQTRNWYDFAVQTGSDFYPVNIKITNTTHADNLNCKLGIYNALTGLIPDFANEIRWVSYFEKFKELLLKYLVMISRFTLFIIKRSPLVKNKFKYLPSSSFGNTSSIVSFKYSSCSSLNN